VKTARKRQVRRDRRKAKVSGWRRAGKTSMGARVGHGNASAGRPSRLPGRKDSSPPVDIPASRSGKGGKAVSCARRPTNGARGETGYDTGAAGGGGDRLHFRPFDHIRGKVTDGE
jgi:hypothetical protein